MSQLHGGNIYHYASKLGIPVSQVIDFSASINPLGLSKAAVRAILDAMPLLVNYPDPGYSTLRDAIATRYNIPPESILVGNGSTELIYLLPRALKPATALLPIPSFSDYGRALSLNGCSIEHIPATEADGFKPDMAAIANLARGRDMVVICNPNNPTGVLLSRAELMNLAHVTHDSGAFIVIDEAFIDYTPEASVVQEAARSENIAVLRNFTKFHAMPGMRVGYIVSHPWVISKLEAAREPWSVNILGERAAAASLMDTDYEAKTIAHNEKERGYLINAINKIPGMTAFPSAANFLLVKLTCGLKADDLTDSLAEKGLLIRSCTNFLGLYGEFIRVAVKSRKENRLLLGMLAGEMRR